MAGPSRYSLNDEEAGVTDGVLKNKLGIRDQKELDDAETLLFSDAYEYFFDLLAKDRLEFNISIIHSELNAIHPFREGNGRTIRLFLDLLAVRAGYNPIDWSKYQSKYIVACVEGMIRNYDPMEKIIYAGLTKHELY